MSLRKLLSVASLLEKLFYAIYNVFVSSKNMKYTRCLKIIKTVSYNIASEASYVYISSVQNFIKNAKNAPFGGQPVLPDR